MKKQKTLLNPLILGVVAIVGFTTTTFIAEAATSNATIKAIAGEDPVAPVNPEYPDDPDKPGPTDPGDGNTTNQTGPLQINYLSHLDFGDNIAITGRSVEANVKNTTPRFFQVSDLRGTAGGWKLNVSLGNFIPTDSKSDKAITGATITFRNGEAVTSNTNLTDAAKMPTDPVILKAGDSGVQTIMSADKGTGRGTWLARFTAKADTSDNENIVFKAPTNSITANTDYKAILTWQLVDAAK